MQGKIKKLTDKFYGFISADDLSSDLFFHGNELDGLTFEELNEGDLVEFEIKDTPKGQAAVQIKKA